MARSSFEMESFIPSTESYYAPASSREKCRKVVPKRISTFVSVICCLVVLALILNLMGSMVMVVSPRNSQNQVDKSGNHSSESLSNGASNSDSVVQQQSTSQPTLAPTNAPTRAPVASPQYEVSTGVEGGSATMSQSHANSWLANYGETAAAAADATAQQSPPVTIVPHTNSDASQAFVERWCDLQGIDWYPTGTKAWQQRAPAVLIPGAKMSGTLCLAHYLEQHPSVVAARTKELSFFYERNFGRYVTAQERTKVRAARERMYARDYYAGMLKQNTTKLSLDATPGYLFYSSLLPRRILCVMPWIKLVVLVRDPVDRFLAHYQTARSRGLRMSLEDWMEKEFSLMNRVGLLNATVAGGSTQFSGSAEEDFAWYEYQTATLEGSIGRGLYEIQLRQWFQALRAVGRNPADSVLIVRTELLESNPAGQYAQILKFLGLTEWKGANFAMPVTANVTQTMSASTRQRLQDFYAPYNARLNRLLQSYRVDLAE